MNIALFGATGFVGNYLIEALCEQGMTPCVLIRPKSEHKLRHAERCRITLGVIADQTAIAQTLDRTDCVIYNIGILRENRKQGITFAALQLQGIKDVIEAAVDSGVRRFILMSANGIHRKGTEYQTTKYNAEQALKVSGLDWTIFRPSVLFGNPRGKMEFATQLNAELIHSPFPAPLFYPGILPLNPGNYEMSPAHVSNVAQAFIAAIIHPETIGKTIHLGGPDNLSWKRIIQTIAAAQNMKKRCLPVPAGVIALIARLMQRFSWFPVTSDQIKMLLEGNTCDTSGFQSLGIQPLPFSVENLQYLNEYS